MHLNAGLTLMVLCAVHLSCSASESTPETTSSPETAPETATTVATLRIESLNKVVGVTDPVAAFPAGTTSTSATTAKNFDQLIISTGLKIAATKGVSLGSKTTKINDDFVAAAGSKIYCDTVNNGMKFFIQAAIPDSNLCMLRMGAKKFPIKPTGFQTWDFKMPSMSGTFNYRMKFSLETNADGSLKKFESFACQAMGTASLAQTGYLLETVADNKITIHNRSKDAGGMGRDAGSVRADVLSEINSDGRLVGLKTIDFADKTGDRTVHTKVVQSATNVQAIGYEYVQSRETKYLTFSELIDSNAATGQYYITKIAYGDGAGVTKVAENGGSPVSYTTAWNGDTLKTDLTKSRLAKVQNRESEMLGYAGDTLDVSFAAAETYDCSGTADQTFEPIAGSTPDTSCYDAYNIDPNGRALCTTLSY